MSDQTPMGKIIGKWPGNETDEEIQAVMDAMDPVKQLREENARLREELRWRKWPEEKPEAGGKYLVIWFDDAKGLWLDDIKVVQCNEPLRECFFKLGYFYWRPIGPLPGGE